MSILEIQAYVSRRCKDILDGPKHERCNKSMEFKALAILTALEGANYPGKDDSYHAKCRNLMHTFLAEARTRPFTSEHRIEIAGYLNQAIRDLDLEGPIADDVANAAKELRRP